MKPSITSAAAAEPETAVPKAVEHYLRPGTLQLPALPPLGVYVHLPWCLKKCPYCDFNSHAVPAGAASTHSALPETRYLDALRADLESALPLVWGRKVSSIFIGGGTPSLFSPQGVAALISDLRALLPLEPGVEITLEANPGTFEKDRFKAFAQAGVTRLSIGVQSFDDGFLQRIGRVHNASQARAAVQEAQACFETFNVDLMYALPGQTVADLDKDLDAALSFSPPHLSIYHLTVEPNTYFATHPPTLPDDDTAADMLDLIAQRTQAQGLQRYEVSAFAQEGHRCRHNLNYWQFGDYLGLGAGAHGKLSFPHRVLRQVRWREPAAYMDKALQGRSVSNEHEVARASLPFEFMLNALRLRDGFAQDLFTTRTGMPASAVQSSLAQACDQGLLEPTESPAGWRPTARGFDFLSDLQSLFLPS